MGGLIHLKSDKEIDIMHEANCIVHDVINYAGEHIEPGVTTEYIDDLANRKMLEHGAKSAFRGYRGFPKVICISVNEEVVHGIPSGRVIQKGDIVTLDFGVYHKGFAGDSARTFVVGNIPEDTQKLVDKTKESLYAGIEAMCPGNRLSDIGRAIDNIAKENGYGNLENFCGHGIGKKMHEDPHVFNYVHPKEPDVLLREGMVLALEPMFTLGTNEVKILDDEWTVVTKDSKPSCHWELSIAITKDGPRVLGTGWDTI